MIPEYFIGTDIVEISRIKKVMAVHPRRFIEKTYTLNEQKYCADKPVPEMHYAGRFAAKEAIKKALFSAKMSSIAWTDIEILSADDGQPIVQLHRLQNWVCKVSISHTEQLATATALVHKSICN